jgi:hypothetical protein
MRTRLISRNSTGQSLWCHSPSSDGCQLDDSTTRNYRCRHGLPFSSRR